MVPGEQPTATRDEHYNLVAFFREASAAERAKGISGIAEEEVARLDAHAVGGGSLPPVDAPSEAPRVVRCRISSEGFAPTVSVLQVGVGHLALQRASTKIDGWEQRPEESGDPELAPIAGNLRRLRTLPSENIDRATAGGLLNALSEQVQEVASGGLGAGVADKLRQL